MKSHQPGSLNRQKENPSEQNNFLEQNRKLFQA